MRIDKTLTVILSALIIASASPAWSADSNVPPGWDLKGDAPTNYDCGVEKNETHNGAKIAFLRLPEDAADVSAAQRCQSTQFRVAD